MHCSSGQVSAQNSVKVQATVGKFAAGREIVHGRQIPEMCYRHVQKQLLDRINISTVQLRVEYLLTCMSKRY